MLRRLEISDYETRIFLGNNEDEKLERRKVIISISLIFSEKNDACGSDDLGGTVCYSKLLNFVNEKLKDASFNLMERIAQYLYDEISKYLNDVKILKRIEIKKPSPPVENLKSASFICSDW
jgi:dihydroneopterin aldolase